MAFRAKETFVVALEDGKRIYQKDGIVPKDVVKGRDGLVYDDAKVSPADPVPFTRGPRVVEEPKVKKSTPVGVAAE